MRERPILFSAPMVRALLAGQKTQTRRVACDRHFGEPKPWTEYVRREHDASSVFVGYGFDLEQPRNVRRESWRGVCPYGQPGDRLWVKETWAAAWGWENAKPVDIPQGAPIQFKADGAEANRGAWDEVEPRKYGRLRPSIFMRRWMSRLTLELSEVRVERLQAISETDARAEGVDNCFVWKGEAPSRVSLYQRLWEKLNGSGSWSANPWVWVLTFKRVEARS